MRRQKLDLFSKPHAGTFEGSAGPVWGIRAYRTLLFTSASDSIVSVWNLATSPPTRMASLTEHQVRLPSPEQG